jgi:hypothetical protein
VLELGEIISRLCLSVSQIGRGIVEQCGYINSEREFMALKSPLIHDILMNYSRYKYIYQNTDP